MISGNTIAQIQTCIITDNEIGEGVKAWNTVYNIAGWLDLSSGDSKYTSFYAKIQESTHIFISDWTNLEGVKPENSRMIVNNQTYDILLIDNPMGMNKQLEIYLKFTGG